MLRDRSISTKRLVHVSSKNMCVLRTVTCRGAVGSECDLVDNSIIVHGGRRAVEENWNGMDPEPSIGGSSWRDALRL